MLQLAAVVVIYLALALSYARITPPWNNPDEPAHYAYVQYIAERSAFPELRAGDWDVEALEQLTRVARFSSQVSLDGATYEYHQPPLYYLLASPLARLTADTSLERRFLVLRAFSIALGAATLLVAFFCARLVYPRRSELWMATAGVVAFVPMFTSISASVNNDSLAILLAACAVWLMLSLVIGGASRRKRILTGVLVGLLLLTKLTVYLFAPLLLLALAWASMSQVGSPDAAERRTNWWRALRPLALALLIAMLVCGWWFARNAALYGLLDPLASARHDAVVVGQLRWSQSGLDPLTALWTFVSTLFRSFWALFGWMAIVVSQRFYLLYLALVVMAVVGTRITVRMPGGRPRDRSRAVPWLIGLSIVGVFGEVVFYNLTFVQPQGRYLFPALVPLAMCLVFGWARLARFDGWGWPVRLRVGLVWGWLAAALTIAIPYLLGVQPNQYALGGPLAAAVICGLVAAWKGPVWLGHLAQPVLLVALVALDAACLVGFVARYYAG